MARQARLYIVCSDRPRNGKTLLARLLADWLHMHDQRPLLFDLDADKADLARFHLSTQVVDFRRTPQRVSMFDAIVESGARDVVLDLPAPLYRDFIDEAETIGFLEAVQAEGPAPLFLHVIDRDRASLQQARQLAARLPGQVRPVRNLALGNALEEEGAASLYLDLFEKGEIVLPRFSPQAMALIEQPGFSFAAFMQGDQPVSSARLRFELQDNLGEIFSQLDRLKLSIGFDDLRRMGLV